MFSCCSTRRQAVTQGCLFHVDWTQEKEKDNNHRHGASHMERLYPTIAYLLIRLISRPSKTMHTRLLLVGSFYSLPRCASTDAYRIDARTFCEHDVDFALAHLA